MKRTLTSRTPGKAGLALSGVSILALFVLMALLESSRPYEGEQAWLDVLPDLLTPITFAVVGAVLSIKQPENVVGAALLLSGVGWIFGGVLAGYGELALLARPEWGLPAGRASAAVAIGSWVPLMAGVFLLLLHFPTGKAPSHRWATMSRFVLASFVLVWLMITVGTDEIDPPLEDFNNPFFFKAAEYLLVVFLPLNAFCLLSLATAGVHLFLRFHRSHGVEREQYKWLAFSVTLLVCTMPFSAFVDYEGIPGAVFLLALIGLPVSVGIAVLRYRLYDIDRILNRTLVYALLSATLAAVYFGLVVGLQALLAPLSGGSDLAIALTTLLVAALFLPARRRIQRVVDQRFNRRNYDAARTVQEFSTRLREELDLDTLRDELLAVLDETMQPAGASLWLRPPGMRP